MSCYQHRTGQTKSGGKVQAPVDLNAPRVLGGQPGRLWSLVSTLPQTAALRPTGDPRQLLLPRKHLVMSVERSA